MVRPVQPSSRMPRFARLLSCAGLALAGCAEDGAAQVSGQTTAWVAPLPAPIQLSWWKAGSDCLSVTYGCEAFEPFAISAMTCDGCDVVLWGPAGFSPATPAELSTFRGDAFTVYAVPRAIGAISFNADLESISGAQQTVTFAGTGARVTAMTATCMQTHSSDGQTVPCGATRGATDEIALTVRTTTTGLGDVALADLLLDASAGDPLESALPAMSPDFANWQGDVSIIDPKSTALKETLTWTVGGATLTATVAIPALAN